MARVRMIGKSPGGVILVKPVDDITPLEELRTIALDLLERWQAEKSNRMWERATDREELKQDEDELDDEVKTIRQRIEALGSKGDV